MISRLITWAGQRVARILGWVWIGLIWLAHEAVREKATDARRPPDLQPMEPTDRMSIDPEG